MEHKVKSRGNHTVQLGIFRIEVCSFFKINGKHDIIYNHFPISLTQSLNYICLCSHVIMSCLSAGNSLLYGVQHFTHVLRDFSQLHVEYFMILDNNQFLAVILLCCYIFSASVSRSLSHCHGLMTIIKVIRTPVLILL